MRLCCWLVVGLVALLTSVSPVSRSWAQPPLDGGDLIRPKPRVEAVSQACDGIVTAVLKDSITVRPENGRPQRRFVACPVLVAGGYPKWASPGNGYRLRDVNVGDKVTVEYSRIDGVEICDAVNIRRRPGGVVPPDHVPQVGPIAAHELKQAMQDWEEKRIPLPARFAPPNYGFPRGPDFPPPYDYQYEEPPPPAKPLTIPPAKP